MKGTKIAEAFAELGKAQPQLVNTCSLYVTNSDDLGTRNSMRLSRVDAWEKFDLTILDRTVVAG